MSSIKSRIRNFKINLPEETECCKNPTPNENRINIVCLNCGTVLNRVLKNDQVRAYTKEEVSKRRQNEPRWRESGSRTYIYGRTDAFGNKLSGEKNLLFYRLSKIQNSVNGSLERNLWSAEPRMKFLCSRKKLPSYIYGTAWKIYVRVARKKLTMGRSIEDCIWASVYAAIRIHKYPSLLDDLCNDTPIIVEKKDLSKALRIIIREVFPELGYIYESITAAQLIIKFGRELRLSRYCVKKALKIFEKAKMKKIKLITGKDPKGIAAGSLYLAGKQCGETRTQKEIAEISKVTEVTVRSRFRQLSNEI